MVRGFKIPVNIANSVDQITTLAQILPTGRCGDADNAIPSY